MKKAGASQGQLLSVESNGTLIRQVKAADFQSSTKIEAVVDEINKMTQSDPSAKVLATRSDIALSCIFI